MCGVVRPAPLALHQSARPTQSSRTLYGYLFQHSRPASPLSACEQANSVVADTLRYLFQHSRPPSPMSACEQAVNICMCVNAGTSPRHPRCAVWRQEVSVDDRVQAQQDLRRHRVIKSHACIAVADQHVRLHLAPRCRRHGGCPLLSVVRKQNLMC